MEFLLRGDEALLLQMVDKFPDVVLGVLFHYAVGGKRVVSVLDYLVALAAAEYPGNEYLSAAPAALLQPEYTGEHLLRFHSDIQRIHLRVAVAAVSAVQA